MQNYLLLYSGGGGQPATDAERQAVLKQWNDWFAKLGSDLVDGGDPFSGKAKTVAAGGMVSDGDMGMMHTGYSIFKADSLDKAVELAKGCPVLTSGGKVTVYETFKVM